MKLSSEEKIALRAVFPDRPDSACGDCGGYHLRGCPRIKLQEWVAQVAGSGNRIKVEYWPDGSYDTGFVVWPEDVFDPEEDDDE